MPSFADFFNGMFNGQTPTQVQGVMPEGQQSPWGQLAAWNQQNPGVLAQIGAGMMAGDPAQGLANAGQLRAGYQLKVQEKAEAKAQRNQTLEYLRANYPDLAGMVEAGMPVSDAFSYSLKQREAEKAQRPQNPWMTAGNGNLFNWQTGETKSFGDGGGGVEYGKTPVYGTDKDGNTVMGVVGSNGTFKPLETGDFNIGSGVEKVDLGTQWGLLNKRTGQLEGYMPKDLAGAAQQTAEGKGAGEALAEARGSVGAARQTAGLVADQIKSLKDDPYLPSMVGSLDSRLPNLSSDAARVQSKMDQLQGGAFLQARQLLKGGGAITDFEGRKAEAAFIRMNAAQNLEDYKAALDEFNDAVQTGLAKLEQKAGGGSPASAPADGATAGSPLLRQKYGLE